jgi:RNA polymerase sigma-70 factor (ECF subfamily)
MISAISNTMRALNLQRKSSSQDLLSRLVRGEPNAVGQVYDQHHEAVRAFAMRLVGDESIAEDLVHDVFVSLPKAARNFRGDSSLRTFLTGIAVNHARHYVRSAARRRAATSRMVEQTTQQSHTHTPEDSSSDKRFLETLARCLDTLPLDQRIAFVLCDVEERSAREAAELTGAPPATMRTRLHHARKKLRHELEKEGFR